MFKLLFAFVVIGVINASLAQRKDYEEALEALIGSKYLSDVWKNSGTSLSSSSSSSSSGDADKSSSLDPVPASIKTKRYHRVIPVESEDEEVIEKVVEVDPYRQPFRILFKTKSNPVKVEQIHTSTPGETENTKSEDEPHRVNHEVLRPVIQEVREVIQPYRRVIQEIRPVLEELHTLVAKKDRDGRETYTESRRSDSTKRQSEQRLRSPRLLRDDSDDSKDDSDKKQQQRYQQQQERIKPERYQLETVSKSQYQQDKSQSERKESYDRKSIDSKKYLKRTTVDESDSILDQMNNILSGGNLKAIDQPLVLEEQDAKIDYETPLLNLNSGNIKLMRRTDRQFSPDDLKWAENYSQNYWITV